MRVVKIDHQREIFILAGKERLTPEKVQEIEEEQKLTDYSLEEFKVYSANTKEPHFKYYEYKLNY